MLSEVAEQAHLEKRSHYYCVIIINKVGIQQQLGETAMSKVINLTLAYYVWS